MGEQLHLKARHRRKLEEILHLPEVEVWAYGSRVSGESHGGSDLDLVLRGPGLEKIPLAKLLTSRRRCASPRFLVERLGAVAGEFSA